MTTEPSSGASASRLLGHRPQPGPTRGTFTARPTEGPAWPSPDLGRGHGGHIPRQTRDLGPRTGLRVSPETQPATPAAHPRPPTQAPAGDAERVRLKHPGLPQALPLSAGRAPCWGPWVLSYARHPRESLATDAGVGWGVMVAPRTLPPGYSWQFVSRGAPSPGPVPPKTGAPHPGLILAPRGNSQSPRCPGPDPGVSRRPTQGTCKGSPGTRTENHSLLCAWFSSTGTREHSSQPRFMEVEALSTTGLSLGKQGACGGDPCPFYREEACGSRGTRPKSAGQSLGPGVTVARLACWVEGQSGPHPQPWAQCWGRVTLTWGLVWGDSLPPGLTARELAVFPSVPTALCPPWAERASPTGLPASCPARSPVQGPP